MWVSKQLGHTDWAFTARTYSRWIDLDAPESGMFAVGMKRTLRFDKHPKDVLTRFSAPRRGRKSESSLSLSIPPLSAKPKMPRVNAREWGRTNSGHWNNRVFSRANGGFRR